MAEKLGGRRLPRSGGLAWSKYDKTTAGGDLTTKEFLIEHKRVEPHVKSVSIKRDWLKKVTEGANRSMKEPAMVLTFEQARGHEGDWMLLPMSLVERLLSNLKAEE